MPKLRKENKVIAIACADIHLSHKPPVAREGEEDWYAAMKRPLDELKALKEKYNAPIVCAGDVFNHWKPPPLLTNFAMKNLPDMISIPGQHDLPLHNYQEMRKSAYLSLMLSDKIQHIAGVEDAVTEYKDFDLYGFPFGFKVEPPLEQDNEKLKIALLHQYVWIKGKSYIGASNKFYLGNREDILEGYDVVIVGDNHIPFKTTYKRTKVYNCGSLMRRNSDEIDHRPRVGLVKKNGDVESHFLNIEEDKIEETEGEEKARSIEEEEELRSFLDEMDKLEETSLDFVEVLERYIKQEEMEETTKKVLLEAIDNDSNS